MKGIRAWAAFLSIVAQALSGCGDQSPTHKSSGAAPEKMAKKHCGYCHAFPEPSLLDKKTWEKDVLPQMSGKLGIETYNGQYLAVLHESPGIDNPADSLKLSFANWMAIVNYYITTAPEKLPDQNRPAVKEFTERFSVSPVVIDNAIPSTSFLKIDPGNRLLYAGNAHDSLMMVFDSRMRPVRKMRTGMVTVDMYFDTDLKLPGTRRGLLTDIGSLYPTDDKVGRIVEFEIGGGRIETGKVVDREVARPVQATKADLDNDGREDILVCAFGHENGEFYYLSAQSDSGYTKHQLDPAAGAINPHIEDVTGDGLPDIITMFAQADEGVYLYTNLGNGKFERSRLLRFSPAHGSSHMEVTDMDGDGSKDILYTSGDNYDYSRISKPYHGVYIFINNGKGNFREQYFFPLYGAYKALARDFDADGDMDIAAISFFPDQQFRQAESFVFLENQGALDFKPFLVRQSASDRWITLDAGDLDGDGDDDIVLGSMLLKEMIGSVESQASARSMPSILLLENQTIR